ncbi:MAG: DUF2169 domain-containing protein [Deltaproteobacteria bacterium]|jgi:hypothetical protein|nr:DUF2169 domain-containing protein [Deltaproteobacteria bacterium]MBW2530525.1 DUF2169 domain-containing protein [Deltaproteobacteria bacterium]
MLEVDNRTPFPAAPIPHQDPAGWDHLVVAIKGTLAISRDGALHPADEQLPLCDADVHHGEPGESSVRYESDRCPQKPGTDVVLNGHAHAPHRRPVTQMDVELRVGALRQLVRVMGDRSYHRSLGRWTISDPAPFAAMPLVYERAFGGVALPQRDDEPIACEERNPVGTGYAPSRRGRDLEGVALPNLEDPTQLVQGPGDCPAPAGFGFIGRHWLPRRPLAGTYDERWRAERAPLAPLDFDPRYHNGAHPRLISTPPLQGGERVQVLGASADGPLQLTLPEAHPAVSVWVSAVEQPQPTTLDTVIVEPDERRVLLTWRATMPISRKLLLVDRIRISGGPR